MSEKLKTSIELAEIVLREYNKSDFIPAGIFNDVKKVYDAEILKAKLGIAKCEAFALGYSEGYLRALELVEFKIKNELETIKKSI